MQTLTDFFTRVCGFVFLLLLMTAAGARSAPIALGERRELFVDRMLVESMQHAELRLHAPTPAGGALQLDRPWEGIVSGYVTVIRDGERMLMYYRGRPTTARDDATAEAHEVSCVAESRDGIRWWRPNLGLHEVSGTRDNNVFLTEPKNVTHNFCPFLDLAPGVPAAEKFKAVGGTGSAGLFGYTSPDGIHWSPISTKPLIQKGQFDSQNVVFWSETEHCYLCYFRTWQKDVRWVARSTSADFRTWSEPVQMAFGDAPPEHIYINQTQPYFRAPHLYIGIAARFNPGRRALTDEMVRDLDLENPRNYAELRNDDSDAVLLTSRGGDRYDRTFLESFIRPGLDPRNWVARANYPALGIHPTSRSEMSLYIIRNYGQPSIHVERLALRTDGFASLHAGYTPGECLTPLVTFSGTELELNLSTGAVGYVRLEILDDQGRMVEESEEIIGDAIERVVHWKSKSAGALAAWVGKPVRLRWKLKDADVYSFRFRTAAATSGAAAASTAREFVTVCSDGGAGGYEAFPDVCRLPDGRLMCIFYASYTHVGVPKAEWPNGGKIAQCFSSDEGRTWSPPQTLLDSPLDDRDPSITALKDGRLMCSFFTSAGAQVVESKSPNGPWSAPQLIGPGLGVSSPVRELSDGVLMLGTYFENDREAHGNVIRSLDGGHSWEPPIQIDSAGQFLDAETDVIELRNGDLFAALRGGKGSKMHGSRSHDRGKTWEPARSLGFVGHCPYLHRSPGGAVVLAYRQPEATAARGTALRVSEDEAKTWGDPVSVDSVIGAYPSMVNLKDGSVLIVYYEEGGGSNIRARKFRVQGGQVEWLKWN